MKEIWKPIKGFEGSYEVSNLGRVKSLCRITKHPHSGFITVRERILKQGIRRGYMIVTLFKNKKTTKSVHRLVAQAFIPNPENKSEINHKNCKTEDNRIDNLEWCTRLENQQYAQKLGRYKKENGEDNPMAILTNKKVIDIRRKYKKNIYTMPMLAKEYGVAISTIQGIIERSRWNHI